MKRIVALLLLSLVIAAPEYSLDDLTEWSNFKIKYKKEYNQTEEPRRMGIFFDNTNKIQLNRKDFELGLVSFLMGMNEFGDMTIEEFRRLLNGYNNTGRPTMFSNSFVNSSTFQPDFKASVPSSVDWRQKGAVTPVKDQGRCGSCWAFSGTGGLEGQHFLKTGKMVSLSEQNLVDCSRKYGNYGCDGGFTDAGYNYIKDNKGIMTEQAYPYEAKDGKCRYNSAKVGATDQGAVRVKANENDLKMAIAEKGPISVAVDASHASFQLYKSGIYYEPLCSSTQLDHAILAVGYGTSQGMDYWLVKNSWGKSWGSGGYIKMARNKNNNCGIATEASYPIV